MTTKLIFCMKWGTVYGPDYVNILHAMVARNITGPFQVVCFTDDATGIREEVMCRPLPSLHCEIPPDVPGKWPKVALWSRELEGLEGMLGMNVLKNSIPERIGFTYATLQGYDAISGEDRELLQRLVLEFVA